MEETATPGFTLQMTQLLWDGGSIKEYIYMCRHARDVCCLLKKNYKMRCFFLLK